MFSADNTDTRDFNVKPDGYTEIRCPKKKGVIAAEVCLNFQTDGCRCDHGIGALVQIRIVATEEAELTISDEATGHTTRETTRRVDKANAQLATVARIESALSERESKILVALTPAERKLDLVPIRAICEQCGNGCWGQNRLCSHCIAKASRKPVRFCACGNKIGPLSLKDVCQYCRPSPRRSPDAPPTDMEREVYQFIESWIGQHGKPPLPYQVSAAMGKWSKFGSAYIDWLRRKGFVEGRGFDLKIVKPLPVRGAA